MIGIKDFVRALQLAERCAHHHPHYTSVWYVMLLIGAAVRKPVRILKYDNHCYVKQDVIQRAYQMLETNMVELPHALRVFWPNTLRAVGLWKHEAEKQDA